MEPALSFVIRKKLHPAVGNHVMTIDLTAGDGRLYALHGPSGARKTTILRMIAGLTTPDEGAIAWGSEIWFDSSKKINIPARNRRVGMVFQDYALFPAMTVEKNIAYGIKSREDHNRMRGFIDVFDLKGLLKQIPRPTVGRSKAACRLGQGSRNAAGNIASGRTAMRPGLRNAGRDPRKTIRLRSKARVLTFLVSHDLGEIFAMADRVFTIQNGNIVASGPPAAIFGGSGNRPEDNGRCACQTGTRRGLHPYRFGRNRSVPYRGCKE